jgi:hypothetical protein
MELSIFEELALFAGGSGQAGDLILRSPSVACLMRADNNK